MFDFFLKQHKKKVNHSSVFNGLLEKRYQELVVKHHIQSDGAQIKVLGHLQHLLNNISEPVDVRKKRVLSQILSPSHTPTKSLYIFGDVGRGKTMLMDVFYKACPIESKRRIHFHAFMQEVHDYNHHWRKHNEGDPLPSLAIKITNTSVLLCIDEFQVTDIADAMILARLFTQLFNRGIIFVATSNQHPDDLYKNGLQRALFLPFVKLLKESSEVLELVAKEDYRLSYFKSMKKTFYLESEGGGYTFLRQRFNELTNNGSVEAKILQVKGRDVYFKESHGDILLTSFFELCERELGPADYLAIAKAFNTILIAGIPELSANIRDSVRRFTTLIDALYEHHVKLICTVAVPVEQLYLEDHDFSFKRTRSRLIEMQSEAYFRRENLVV